MKQIFRLSTILVLLLGITNVARADDLLFDETTVIEWNGDVVEKALEKMDFGASTAEDIKNESGYLQDKFAPAIWQKILNSIKGNGWGTDNQLNDIVEKGKEALLDVFDKKKNKFSVGFAVEQCKADKFKFRWDAYGLWVELGCASFGKNLIDFNNEEYLAELDTTPQELCKKMKKGFGWKGDVFCAAHCNKFYDDRVVIVGEDLESQVHVVEDFCDGTWFGGDFCVRCSEKEGCKEFDNFKDCFSGSFTEWEISESRVKELCSDFSIIMEEEINCSWECSMFGQDYLKIYEDDEKLLELEFGDLCQGKFSSSPKKLSCEDGECKE